MAWLISLDEGADVPGGQWRCQRARHSSDVQGEADEYREKLIEAVAEMDDELLARYLEGGEISYAELKQALRDGVVAGSVFPCVLWSGLRCAGFSRCSMLLLTTCLLRRIVRP